MDGYEMEHMDGALLIWQQRLKKINADDVVRMMG
jgi:hypothetical protein